MLRCLPAIGSASRVALRISEVEMASSYASCFAILAERGGLSSANETITH